jgi:DHA2 family multidrug resistance protein
MSLRVPGGLAPALSRISAWWTLPVRAIVGFGFMEHAYAKLARGPESFTAILHALGMPFPALLSWATILTELIGGAAVLLGVLIPLVSIPMIVVLLVAIVTVHLPNGFSSIKLQSVDAAGAHFGRPGYETDLLYLAAIVALAMGGPGPLMLDRALARAWSGSRRRFSAPGAPARICLLGRSWKASGGVPNTSGRAPTRRPAIQVQSLVSESSSGAPQPMTGLPLAITAVALALGTFMQVLDSTIANVSIPTIAGDLGVSTEQGTWVVTSFAVANGVSVPLTGWLMRRFGVVRTFVVSVILFTIASFLCGVSWSLGSLIVFRIIQGGVSGPLIPGSQALMLSIFPLEKRGTGLAIWSMTTLVAPVCGPVLGGYISDNYSWPWIFFINVPVGALCAFLCWSNLRSRETPSQRLRVDGVGLALLVIWVGCLQVMLDTGEQKDWFANTPIVIMTITAVIGFFAWVIWESTEEHPMVDLSLFRSRNFAMGTVAYSLAYAVFFGNNLLLPLWLQTDIGYIATWAGMVAAPAGVVAVLLTPLVSRWMGRFDARMSASLAIVAFAASYFMRAGYTPQASFGDYVIPMLVQGVSMSIFFVAMVTIVLADMPPERIPAAAGLSNFCRYTAGSFAASVTTTVWNRREALHQTRLAESVHLDGGLPHLALSARQMLGAITQEAERQAYTLSALDFFWASGWVMLMIIPLLWLTRRPVVTHAGGAGD